MILAPRLQVQWLKEQKLYIFEPLALNIIFPNFKNSSLLFNTSDAVPVSVVLDPCYQKKFRRLWAFLICDMPKHALMHSDVAKSDVSKTFRCCNHTGLTGGASRSTA